MIAFIEGKVDQIVPTHCIVNVNGVGYQIQISLHTYKEVYQKETVKLLTQMIVREDAQLLYGFYSIDEKQMFNTLISVSGIGPSSALLMLSTLSVGEIQNAILSSNAKLLQTVKGIGAKSAQRVIIDLKDKVGNIEVDNKISGNQENKLREEALNALEVLGVNKRQSEKQITSILANEPDIQVEDVIKKVLKNLR